MQGEKNNIEENENKNEKAYDTASIIENKKNNYYDESIYALIEYMKNNEKNPNEKRWDQIAIRNEYLSSKTIGYVSGVGFNKLCRNLRKQINKEKRQINT